MEEWKSIKDYEESYEISSHGRIRSLKRIVHCKNGRKLKIKESILEGTTDSCGYHRVNLCKKGINQSVSVHRLVALSFIKNIEGKPEVNHIDGNKKNNRIDNLEWCTHIENSVHAFKTGLMDDRVGENNVASKLKEADVVEIKKLIKAGCTQKSIAGKYNVTSSTIGMISNGTNWRHVKLKEAE